MILRPYQRQFWATASQHRTSIWIASRQIGKSVTLAMWALARALEGDDVAIFSASLVTCREMMRKVGGFAQALFPGFKPGKLEVDLPSQRSGKIVGLSANPRTARSFSGHVIFDEFEYYAEPEEVWRAAVPIATNSGYHVVLASSPLCEGSFGHRRVTAVDSDGRALYPVLYTDIYTAVEEGCPADIETIQRELDDDEAFQAEYCCSFASRRSIFFDLDQVRAAQSDRGPRGGELYAGIDIGRTNDLTVLTPAYRSTLGIHVGEQLVLRALPFEAQLKRLSEWITTHKPLTVGIDASLMGAMMYEYLDKAHPGIVVPLKPSDSLHDGAASRVKALLSHRELTLPHEVELVNDFRRVRRDDRGHVKTSRDKRGHADRFWSLAYAVHTAVEHAAINVAKPVTFTPVTPSHRRISC